MFCRLMFILSIILALSEASYRDLGRVVLTNVVFNHGETKLWNEESYRSESFIGLRNSGMEQMFDLGRHLRTKYKKILPTKYSPHDIYVRSTDIDWTLMSAELVLAGLYPAVGDQIWKRLMYPWRPIPVHTVPVQKDNLLAGQKPCLGYGEALQEAIEKTVSKSVSNEKQMKSNPIKDFLDTTGERINEPATLVYWYKKLLSESGQNKTPLDWTNNVWSSEIPLSLNATYSLFESNKYLHRYRSGPLIKEMVFHMRQKVNDTLRPNRKVFMYSAHDESIASLLMALGVSEHPFWPTYSAVVFLELRVTRQNEYVVTISYIDLQNKLTLLTLPGCTSVCPLSTFIKLIEHLIPRNWDEECLQTQERTF
ncbi:prostatic acid phosphatase-like [Fopius arisanus]|uniref:acid phosphatase n=1 Tax=Fopius arisanus TaxID=64838 RepID=A0A9R1T9Z3_9HYME|nr:PREDICTED: prostatic acid phosphatase-like [Fopius arisanus]